MRRVLSLAGVCAVLGSTTGLRAEAEPPFVVIVNAANPVTTLAKADASRLFLKRTIVWKHGGKVMPIDLGEGSPARKAFSVAVLGKDVPAVKGYWQQLIFTGKGIPPIEKSTEAEVVAYVAANPTAIGYVSPAASAGAGVKVLQITD